MVRVRRHYSPALDLSAYLIPPQVAFQSFFGIGPNVSARLLAKHHLHDICRVGELETKQILEINATLTEMKIENDLRRQILADIARLKNTGTYRGKRHAMGLPVRGQKTHAQVSSMCSAAEEEWQNRPRRDTC
jgi:small subunit ribosomal protein S13